MKRVRKIIENFTTCIYCNGLGNVKISESDFGKCHLCHGTGLRIKKRIFFYPDDR